MNNRPEVVVVLEIYRCLSCRKSKSNHKVHGPPLSHRGIEVVFDLYILLDIKVLGIVMGSFFAYLL